MIQKFIERPVLSTVISILIVLLGYLGLTTLPIQQFPDIAPPTVNVTAYYPGANAETILKNVVTPIEEAINGVEGMSYITSASSNAGTVSITVYFELGTNADIASVNVQNRVATVTNKLPAIVVQSGIVTKKMQNSTLMYICLYSDNPDFNYNFLDNYAKINLVPVLQRINGVGEVSTFGSRDYSMRIWLNPEKMASYKLIPSDIHNAINEQSINAAPGKFGENTDGTFEYVIRYKGRFSDVKEYENIIVRSEGNGKFLRLKDVAKVELSAYNIATKAETNGKPSMVIGIKQTIGSNANTTIIEVEEVLNDIAKSFPPGVSYVVPMNAKNFLDASIEQVIHTLIEAFLLVFIVVFIFLQDFRSTLIPAIAVPVAIIGTFFFLKLFGYSINMLTLFALVLAIGIVVDDAIVVVEAVHAKLEGGAKSARKASISAMSEITGAIVSITLVMSAVFIPVTFITGPTGMFYRQFAVTLAVAIIISAVNALTLSPALCALFLKPHTTEGHAESQKMGIGKRMATAFNTSFDTLTNKYTHAVAFFIRKKWLTFGLLALVTFATYSLFQSTSSGFIPSEDLGQFYCDISLPEGTTLERTVEVSRQVDSIVGQHPMIQDRLFIHGFSMLAGTRGSSKSFGVVKMKPWGDRKEDAQHVNAVIKQLFGMVAPIKDAKVIFFAPPTVRGFGSSSGFEFQIQDKTGGELKNMEKVAGKFLAKLNQRPEIQYAMSAFSTKYPQLEMTVNVEKVKEAGIQYNTLFSTLSAYYGSQYITDFSRFGKQYRVIMQATPEDRATAASLDQIYIRNNQMEMVPVSQFVSLTKTSGPDMVKRFNLFNSMTVRGNVNAGYSTGDAIAIIEETASQELPQGFGFEYSGMTREEQKSGGESSKVFLLSLVFVYFLLCAQYESYILPFAVLLSLPVGIFGAISFINLSGLANNIYFQVALIMLIGLLAKNAILIVEFALHHRRNGEPLIASAIEGARQRLRPILMTSFAFILGLLPLMLSNGAGAVGNRSIGTGAVGGMLIGTILGVFIIPCLFVLFQSIQEKLAGGTKKFSHELVEVDDSDIQEQEVIEYK